MHIWRVPLELQQHVCTTAMGRSLQSLLLSHPQLGVGALVARATSVRASGGSAYVITAVSPLRAAGGPLVSPAFVNKQNLGSSVLHVRGVPVPRPLLSGEGAVLKDAALHSTLKQDWRVLPTPTERTHLVEAAPAGGFRLSADGMVRLAKMQEPFDNDLGVLKAAGISRLQQLTKARASVAAALAAKQAETAAAEVTA